MVQSSHYVLFFGSCRDAELHAYDTKEPHRAVKDIMTKNPDFEFLAIESFSSYKDCADICAHVRLARRFRERLIPQAENFSIKVDVNLEKEPQVV